MLYNLRFFSLSSKCSLFHNANLFGFCIIHIIYTGCAKIKKNNSGTKRLKKYWQSVARCHRILSLNISHWYFFFHTVISVSPFLPIVTLTSSAYFTWVSRRTYIYIFIYLIVYLCCSMYVYICIYTMQSYRCGSLLRFFGPIF